MTGTRESLEREVKLDPGVRFTMPDLGGEALASRVFVSTYHDTRDHRLARSGLTLRHRVENGRGAWQLKLPEAGARREVEEDGAPGTVPPGMAALLHAFLRGRTLVPVARLRTRRDGLRVSGAEVVHDVVSVLDGQRVARTFDELEVELVEGDERTLKRLEKALRRAGATDGEARPKLFRALDLAHEPDLEELPADATAGARLAAALRAQYLLLLAHDPGTRLGADPESLHQQRVATRRLRAFLRTGRPLLAEGWTDPLRREIAWLGAALGPVRDLDVLRDQFRADAETLEPADSKAAGALLGVVRRRRAAARRRLIRALGSDRYGALLDDLEAAVDDPPLVEHDGEQSLEGLWRAEHRRLRKTIRALPVQPPDAGLHGARIELKRARYAAELAGRASYVGRAKALQDVLGEHQDSVVAEAWLRDVAARMPEVALAAGRLIERELERRERARRSWRKRWRALAKEAEAG